MLSSVRARLTLTVTVLSLVLSVTGVALGAEYMKDRIVDDAVDEAFDGASSGIDAGLPFAFFVRDVFGPDFSFGPNLGDDVATSVFGELFEGELFEQLIGSELFDIERSELSRIVGRIETAGYGEQLADIMAVPTGTTVVTDGLSVVSIDGPRLEVSRATLDADAPVVVVPLDQWYLLEFSLFGNRRASTAAGDADLRFVVDEIDESVAVGAFVDLTARLGAVDEIRSTLWIAAAVLTIVAGLSTWLLTGRALRPVRTMTRRVGEISSRDLTERVPEPATHDEVHELATTMNDMLERLEIGDRQRRQFVSDASHELRTPVAVLRSEAEVAMRAPESTSIEALAASVHNESLRLGVIVEDLLTLARSDEHGPRPALEAVDLDDVVMDEAGRPRRLSVDRRAVSGGRVHGRRDEVARMVAHLLDNAVRHAVERVAVGVATDRPSSKVQLWVDDDGAGIPPGERSRVFERFVRLEEARSRDNGGAGLGLAVVATTVHGLGGTVEVTDSPLGGARFVITLPAAS